MEGFLPFLPPGGRPGKGGRPKGRPPFPAGRDAGCWGWPPPWRSKRRETRKAGERTLVGFMAGKYRGWSPRGGGETLEEDEALEGR